MIKQKKLLLLLFSLVIIVLGFSSVAYGMVGGVYTLNWWDVPVGSHTATGENYVLSSTSGQTITGVMISEDYRLTIGFWAVTDPSEYFVHLPVIRTP